ncbi:hypothetical protein EV360DRAFT_86979 [Lentinula raphanica]|nr:hypothetical protein EV360DRAFT_86979 [Lentinula raphanica]
MPANSSPRRITEARNTAMNSPYRIITYSKRDRLTRSRRTLSNSSSDEPIVISNSDDDRSPTTNIALKPKPKEKGKGKGKGKAKMVMPGISSDDDVVLISGPSKAGPSRQPTDQNHTPVESEAQETSEELMDLYRKQEEHLNCSICLEIVNRPYVLWCGHFFCAECLDVHANDLVSRSANPTCPTCRTVHGRFNPIESHALQQQANELREALHLPQPERGTLVWPVNFIEQPPLPYPRRRDDTIFKTFTIPRPF